MALIDSVGRVPYDNADTTRNWVETTPGMRVSGKLRPNIVLRHGTDTNYIMNIDGVPLYNAPYTIRGQTHSIMGLGLPGQRVPNILNWTVQETSDQLVQTATFDAMNAHQITTTTTTLAVPMDGLAHSLSIQASYVQNSLGTVSAVYGNTNVATVEDPTYSGVNFYENNVQYRQFNDQAFIVTDGSKFPNPCIPDDDDNDVATDSNFLHAADGVGAYYVLIDDEIIRVTGRLNSNTYTIRAGGRGVNGVYQEHAAGAKVTLLNLGRKTGEYVGLGYLNVDDFNPQSCILRPGTVLTSYEGYGTFPNQLYHDVNDYRNPGTYVFTGFWMVNAVEPQLQDDGTAKVTVSLKSAANILDQQKVTPDLITRLKTKLDNWKIRPGGDFTNAGEAIFGAAGHDRDIPGDWVDFTAWDPSLKDSYPLAIRTELAQHKAYFQHMQDTQMGLNCEICQQERADFVKAHPNLLNAKDDTSIKRQMGRHIYQESIRVMNGEGGNAGADKDGPIRTFIRLMATLAAASWEHPALGLDLAQRFSKMPAALYDNIRNVYTGLIFCGRVDFALQSNDPNFDWTTPTYDDNLIYGNVSKLLCPFESQYDKAPFWQPMQDLADVNGLTLWMNREGYPVMLPRLWSLRPNGMGYKDLAMTWQYTPQLDAGDGWATAKSWFMTHGSSITAYSYNIGTDDMLTQVWTTATTAFDSTFTVASSGTGFSNTGQRLLYSALGGNRAGLSLTSGIQQVDTVSLDNLVLGMDWDTKGASWGVQQVTSDGDVQVLNPLPPLYDGTRSLTKGATGSAVTRVQQTINFFLIRRYLNPIQDPNHSDKLWFTIPEDGKYGDITFEAVKQLQKFLSQANFNHSGIASISVDGIYGRITYLWLFNYLVQAQDFIKLDVFWYAMNGRDWYEYVAAITGVPVPLKKADTSGVSTSPNSSQSIETPTYVIDDKGMQAAVASWQKGFIRSVESIGNNYVDDSINKVTVRSISCGIADPRVQPGDVIWCTIPGFLGMGAPPYRNGIYVTQIQRTLDTLNFTYTATYSGYRYRSEYGQGGEMRGGFGNIYAAKVGG